MLSFMNWFTRRRVVVAAALLCAVALATNARADVENWNDANIKWMSYDEGLALAKKDHKPICLIFFTTWCPHCKNYSSVFSDPQVVKKAQSFVMIRLDKDKNGELSAKYAPDGQYIPRTLFLSSAGEVDPEIHAPRAQYKYFYDEKDPAGVLGGMDQALKKLH
jgi:protein-disulfide reductase (glutathione)